MTARGVMPLQAKPPQVLHLRWQMSCCGFLFRAGTRPVSLNKRFSHGLQAQVSYTFSRNLTTDPLTSVGGNGGCSNGDQNNPKQR